MAVNPRPKSADGIAAVRGDVNRAISKGGSPARPTRNGKFDRGPSQNILLRVPESKLSDIEDLLSYREVQTSRNTWILEAINDKILKDRQALAKAAHN